MTPNPFTRLLHSSRFWMFLITSGSALVIYFATKYLQPTYVEDVKMIIGFIVALAGVVIAGTSFEDVAKANNPPLVQTTTIGTNPNTSRVTTVESKPDAAPIVPIAPLVDSHLR